MFTARCRLNQSLIAAYYCYSVIPIISIISNMYHKHPNDLVIPPLVVITDGGMATMYSMYDVLLFHDMDMLVDDVFITAWLSVLHLSNLLQSAVLR